MPDLCSMAYADDQLVGVSPVNFNAYAPLRSSFAFYRCALPEYRRQSPEHAPAEFHGVATILQTHELDE